MQAYKIGIVLLGFFLVTLVVAGCVPEDSVIEVNDSNESINAEISTGDAIQDNGTGGSPQGPAGNIDDQDAEQKSFSDILSKQRPAEWTIEYDVVMNTTIGNATQTSELTQKIALKGTDMFKTQISGIQDGKPYISQFLQIGTDYYMCFNQDNSWSCLKTQSVEQNNTYDEQTDTAKKYEDRVRYIGDRTIAGRNAECYDLTTDDLQDYEWCYESDTGLLLYAYWRGDAGAGSMTATSVSQSVSAQEFELPAEPVDIADYSYR